MRDRGEGAISTRDLVFKRKGLRVANNDSLECLQSRRGPAQKADAREIGIEVYGRFRDFLHFTALLRGARDSPSFP